MPAQARRNNTTVVLVNRLTLSRSILAGADLRAELGLLGA